MNEEVKSMGMMVGHIIDINGPRLMFKRKYPKSGVRTFQAYIGMPVYRNDHFITDENTRAIISFIIGGEAGIAPGYEIVVNGKRRIEIVGSKFDRVLETAKRVWNKIDKNNQLQIKASGGVLGGMEG